MTALIDETGHTYGRLTVVKKAGSRRSGGRLRAMWLCRCDCGNETVVFGGNLRDGSSTSCSCYQKETARPFGDRRRLPYGEAAFNHYYSWTKYYAKERKLEWRLTKQEVRKLSKQNCFYCGTPPQQISKSESNNGDYVYNGMDRVDNDVGYTPENVVSCCKQCNMAKRSRSVEEFKNWAIALYDNWAGENRRLL